jgi:transcriptional regulator with XRE-family HTH domain
MNLMLTRIGENIKKYREVKAITQEELALLCKLHRNYIGSIEKGARNISILSLEKIAGGLNVEVTKLLE